MVEATEAGNENSQSLDMVWSLGQRAFLVDQMQSVGNGIQNNS